jgi:hypothetical protein
MGGRGSSGRVASTTTVTGKKTTEKQTEISVSSFNPSGDFSAVISGVSEPVVPEPVNVSSSTKDQASSKLEDFGEKIGGAKKDQWKIRGLHTDDLDAMTMVEANKYVKRDNIWKIDKDALIEEGYTPAQVLIMDRINKSIPAKLSYGSMTDQEKTDAQRTYIETIQDIRERAMNVKTPKDLKDMIDEVFIKPGYVVVRGRNGFQTTEAFYKNEALSASLFNNLHGLSKNFDKIDAVAKQEQIGVPKDMKIPRGYAIRKSSDGLFYILNKHGVVERSIETREEAIKMAQEASQEHKTEIRKKKFVPPQLKHVKRDGKDYRKGSDAQGNHYMKDFGFRAGEFGEWMSEKDRQVSMNYGYDALHDLSDTLGISKKSVALNGRLAIAFGARGNPGSAAHYEPERKVINLTKMHGAGSLAHEWFHALDNVVAEVSGQNAGTYLTTGYTGKNSDIKGFAKLVDTMKYHNGKETKYSRDSAAFDGAAAKTDGRYWQSNEEMAARAFSCYITDKTNGKSDYLSGSSDIFINIVKDRRTGEPKKIIAFPEGEERERINKAFDELFDELKEKNYI